MWLKSDSLQVHRFSCSFLDSQSLPLRISLLFPSSYSLSRCPLPRFSLRCTLDDAVDPPIQPPQYHSYDDISGEPSPALSTSRNNIPDEPFWPADVPGIVRRTRANVPRKSSSKPQGKPGSRRRKSAKAPFEYESSPSSQSLQLLEKEEEEDDDDDEDEYRDEYVMYKESDPKEPEKEPVKELTPLPNEKLWYNWRKLPPEKEPWHDFSRPPPDNFAVLAAAAAKTGQIKLFGEKPTVTETVLARARKHALKKERLDLEKKRRKEIGAMAYYSEWVKAWKKDTSKEAVQKCYEETGQDESIQLIEMFSHQTFAEYRVMMGTDPRIARDPLAIRMSLDEKKAIWGGDPVYPTINYYQDPNQKIDYRGPNFHEPRISIFESLRKAGRLITREELKKMHQKEDTSQFTMEQELEDAIAEAVDIGEKEEDEKEEGQDGQEGDEDEDQIVDGEEDEGDEEEKHQGGKQVESE